MTTLPVLLERRAAGREVHAFLDHVGHDDRVRALSALSRAEQRQLYEGAADAEPLVTADFVPLGRAPLLPVPHMDPSELASPGGELVRARPRTRRAGGSGSSDRVRQERPGCSAAW